MENSPAGKYEFWNSVQHRFGFAVVFGLLLETVLAFWLPEPWWIKGLTLLSDTLIAGGVWGEIWAGNKATVAGDAIVEGARAQAAEAHLQAAAARERTAEIEKLTAWRRILPEHQQLFVETIKERTAGLRAMVEYKPAILSLSRSRAPLPNQWPKPILKLLGSGRIRISDRPFLAHLSRYDPR